MNVKIHITLSKCLFTHIYNKSRVSLAPSSQTTKILLQRNEAFRSSHPVAFLEISQNSQENTCARVSFLIKLQA